MRHTQKQEILELIKTLYEAHNQIRKYIDLNNIQYAENMLNQCQECAITIGSAIERLEGKGFITISYIEEYCDTLYYSYEALSNDVISDFEKNYKNLKKELLKIENSIKNDIRVKKEVVFFTYKASMWDSLESIYIAAKEDPNCDAYCVPIPYYDINADGSLGQAHYEGDKYPRNVEITNWTTYNFEKRKPDIIYIHNPYDDCNLVTCVHPRFFSSNLRKYTKKLVYVPYFVLDEISPDNQSKIDRMKHFILLPGVINSDKVIVQSENMKKIYINEYLKEIKKIDVSGKYINPNYLEKKILAMGSPKFDKIINAKKEDFSLPYEWKCLIKNREVILFNTSIKTFLNYGEDYLVKLSNVLEFFKTRKDVVLWWRPHPLLLSTVDRMRTELSKRYKSIVSEYKYENYGIYDDTADLDRAIVCTDRYYGDRSSLVFLYGVTGKPVLISIIKQRKRENQEIKSWRTGDVEKGDLAKWIENPETWKIKNTFEDIYGDSFFDGKNGERIFKFCMEGK